MKETKDEEHKRKADDSAAPNLGFFPFVISEASIYEQKSHRLSQAEDKAVQNLLGIEWVIIRILVSQAA